MLNQIFKLNIYTKMENFFKEVAKIKEMINENNINITSINKMLSLLEINTIGLDPTHLLIRDNIIYTLRRKLDDKINPRPLIDQEDILAKIMELENPDPDNMLPQD